MAFDARHEWIEGFDSWEEVAALLGQDWVRIEDREQGLELENGGDGLFLVEFDRELRARQRRGLHRCGFRPTPVKMATLWQWDVEQALSGIDLGAFRSDVERLYDRLDADAREVRVQGLRTWLASEHLIREQVQQVLQDVFRSSPRNLVVVLYWEPELWEDEDESWETPTG